MKKEFFFFTIIIIIVFVLMLNCSQDAVQNNTKDNDSYSTTTIEGTSTSTSTIDTSTTFGTSSTNVPIITTIPDDSTTTTTIDATPPTAIVDYSTTEPTNGDVTATITPSESVIITNNGGSDSYTFTANGSFTFNFTDTTGNTGSVTATVNNIDKTQPADPAISTNPTTPTSGDVTVTITYSGDSIVKQYKIGIGSYQNYTGAFSISEDTTVYAKAQDKAGNWSNEVSYNITNIDKGNITVNINLITPTEYTIIFGAFDGELDKNLNEVLNVAATLDGASGWEWYLDGDSLSITTSNCSIDSTGYDLGHYCLTVYATKNGVLYSGTIEFDIVN